MTFEEKLFYSFMQNIYTFSICEIVSIDNGNSVAVVKPVTGGSNITDVPIFALGSSTAFLKIKLSSGDVVPVLHSKDDISDFLANKNQGNPDRLSKFSKTNAVILPFKVNFLEGGFSIPETDFEFTGNTKFVGNVEITGDVTSDGTITGKTEVVAGANPLTAIGLSTHIHNTPSGPSNGPIPPPIP